jgi:hypothetical protein
LIPDQDNGGLLIKAFQAMILQTDEKIFVMPAWPRDWNADSNKKRNIDEK